MTTQNTNDVDVAKSGGVSAECSDVRTGGVLLYDFLATFFDIVFKLFFRQIQTRGTYKIPATGPVIFVAAPHSNQFVDPMMILTKVFRYAQRRVSFLIAMVSYKRPFIGPLSRAMQAIPVGRSQDTLRKAAGRISSMDGNDLIVVGEGTKFKSELKKGMYINIPGSGDLAEVADIDSETRLTLKRNFESVRSKSALAKGCAAFRVADHVDNSEMFRHVFDHLASNGCIGIFPEGGSHDRTEMLPLKAGVAIMALGTVAKHPECDLKIVPVGLNYFHPNKFRSRAVIEFGDPLRVDPELLSQYKEGGEVGKKAVGKMLSQIADALGSVTVNVHDYETLMVIQACQRLYRPNRHIPLSLSIEFTRRFVQGYNLYKDDERVISLKAEVMDYNKKLHDLGMRDHLVPTASLNKRLVLERLAWRTLRALVIAALCVPGVTLFAPVFIGTKIVSRRKAAAALKASNVKVKANDVIATWKILVALWLVPTLYTIYSALATWYLTRVRQVVEPMLGKTLITFGAIYGILILVSYSTLKIGEVGVDIFGTLWPLVLALSPSHSNALLKLKEQRQDLVFKVTVLVNDLGPLVFPDIAERLDRNVVQHRDLDLDAELDPRTDLVGVESEYPGDYDLSTIPVFSTVSHTSESVSRASTTQFGESPRSSVDGLATSTELNEEITRRIKLAMSK